jgi:hypothetical protein
MVTECVDGMTRTKIIDCVSTWSELNFESSSDPSNSTVNAPGTCATALGEGDVSSVGDGEGPGDGTVTT